MFHWNDDYSKRLESFWLSAGKQWNIGMMIPTKCCLHSTCLGPKLQALLRGKKWSMNSCFTGCTPSSDWNYEEKNIGGKIMPKYWIWFGWFLGCPIGGFAGWLTTPTPKIVPSTNPFQTLAIFIIASAPNIPLNPEFVDHFFSLRSACNKGWKDKAIW